MLVPKLRFREFNDEWKSYNLKDILEIKNGLNKEKEFFGIGTPIINYMDVNKNSILTSKKIKGKVSLSQKEINNFSVKKGDIFFTRTSETSEEIGLASSLVDNIENCVFSGFVLKASPINDTIFSNNFPGYYFRTDKLRKEIIKHSSITTRALTSGTLLYSMNILIPSKLEQTKIANTFELLDQKIELQTKKIEALKLYKKGLINFFYSEKDLTVVEIRNMGEIITGTTPSKEVKEYWNNGTNIWVTPTDIGYCRDISDSPFKITNSGLKKGRFIPKDSVLVTCIASIGKNAIIKKDGSCNQQINAIVPNKSFNYNYIYYLMEYISEYMRSIAGTSATSIINKNDFSKIKVRVHQYDRQIYIDKILSSFELKINLEEVKYKSLLQLKKCLMIELFV